VQELGSPASALLYFFERSDILLRSGRETADEPGGVTVVVVLLGPALICWRVGGCH